jgi:hypothetical protein
VKVSVPVAAPTADGEKVTPTVQLAPAAIVEPQVLLATAKPDVTAAPLKASDSAKWFVRVTVFALLVAPATTLPKLMLVEDSVTGTLQCRTD